MVQPVLARDPTPIYMERLLVSGHSPLRRPKKKKKWVYCYGGCTSATTKTQIYDGPAADGVTATAVCCGRSRTSPTKKPAKREKKAPNLGPSLDREAVLLSRTTNRSTTCDNLRLAAIERASGRRSSRLIVRYVAANRSKSHDYLRLILRSIFSNRW